MINRFGALFVFLLKSGFETWDLAGSCYYQQLTLPYQKGQKSSKDTRLTQNPVKRRMSLHGPGSVTPSLKRDSKRLKEEVKQDPLCVTLKTKILSYVSK